MKPRVSVVIPTYNRKSVLLESIASVQNQTVRELEILVCDDGSTDGSSDAVGLLMQRDARIRWIPGEHSGYPGISRNRGIRAAAGEWIAFQDSDDLWLPQKLERQLRIPDSISDARFIYSYAVTQFPDGSRKRMTPFRVRRQGRVFETLLLHSVIQTPTVLVRRDALDQAGLFDEQMKLTIAEDYELYLRLAAEFSFYFVAEELVICRPQHDSISADVFGGLDQIAQVLLATIRKFDVPQPLAALVLSRVDLRRYKHRLLKGYPREARMSALKAALGRYPGGALAWTLWLAELLCLARLVRAFV